MFENLLNFFKKKNKNEDAKSNKDTAKERLHLVLMQDRANVSADFLEMMKQEIIEVIKKYIDVEEKEIDVKLTNKTNEDGSVGAPALYANIPIAKIKNEKEIGNIKEKEIEENTKKEDKNVKQESKEKVVEKKEKEDIKNKSKEEKDNTQDVDKSEDKEEENKEKDSSKNAKKSKTTAKTSKKKK